MPNPKNPGKEVLVSVVGLIFCIVVLAAMADGIKGAYVDLVTKVVKQTVKEECLK